MIGNYKALLLDIDDTLYPYKLAHTVAKNKLINTCCEIFSITEKKIIEDAYQLARKNTHLRLSETAASHNRLLYIQRMLEILHLNPLTYTMQLYNVYWDNFLKEMTPFAGVEELFKKYSGRICLLTDLTAHIQHRKINKLGLNNYCNLLVTSEEVGHEKPHPFMFMSALQKLKLAPENVCMIGDNYKKDCLGALNIGIDSIWLNHDLSKNIEPTHSKVYKLNKFDEILKIL